MRCPVVVMSVLTHLLTGALIAAFGYMGGRIDGAARCLPPAAAPAAQALSLNFYPPKP